ncbi:MAG: hypothetical protein C0469_17255 [Cyanobacteria bacterium DS2.3.42]|nr:hypothetical protein [Cyanobacteria bacterium DS2.3.42]
MAITIGCFIFEGPFEKASEIENASGVYVVLCRTVEENYLILEIDEAADLRSHIENHPHHDGWTKTCSGRLSICVMYGPLSVSFTEIRSGLVAEYGAIKER